MDMMKYFQLDTLFAGEVRFNFYENKWTNEWFMIKRRMEHDTVFRTRITPVAFKDDGSVDAWEMTNEDLDTTVAYMCIEECVMMNPALPIDARDYLRDDELKEV